MSGSVGSFGRQPNFFGGRIGSHPCLTLVHIEGEGKESEHTENTLIRRYDANHQAVRTDNHRCRIAAAKGQAHRQPQM